MIAIPSLSLAPRARRRAALAFCLLAPPGLGLLAVALGQDRNWDLDNYHYYNAHAFLTGRLGFDVEPSHSPTTYFNPLFHVPFYYGVELLPPRLLGFLLGTLAGANAVLLYGIARMTIRLDDPSRLLAIVLFVALAGVIGQNSISQLGTTLGDNSLSVLVLGAMLLMLSRFDLFRGHRPAPAITLAAGSGILAGLAAGLKLTMGFYALGLCAACLTLPGSLRRRLVVTLAFGLGVLLGFAITDGFWLVEMARRFGNPFFPFFNDLFQSPMAPPSNRLARPFQSESVLDALSLPFRFVVDPKEVGQIYFIDLRIPIWYGLALLVAVSALAWRLLRPETARGAAFTDRPRANFILATVAGAYVVWLVLFGTYRYLVAIEMLAPLGFLLLVDRLPLPRRGQLGLAALCFVLVFATLKIHDWGRVPWSGHYFGVTAPVLTEPDRTLVVLPGIEPSGFVVPAFPPQVRFVRISYSQTKAPPADTERLAYHIVAAHEGPMFALFRSRQLDRVTATLTGRDLVLRPSGCRPIEIESEPPKYSTMLFCAIDRGS